LKQVKDIEKILKKENAEIKNELKQMREEKKVAKKELVFANKEIKELKCEVSELKEEIKTMRLKTDLVTDKHNLTNEPPSPSFYPSMNLMIAGLERFIEHNEQTKVGSCTDYIKWFDYVFQNVEVNDEILYHYDKYLFMKVRFTKRPPKVIWVSSNGEKKREVKIQLEAPHWTFNTHTLEGGWSHVETKFALILHPNDASKVIEMRKAGFNKSREEWISWKGNLPDLYSVNNDLIICCKKK